MGWQQQGLRLRLGNAAREGVDRPPTTDKVPSAQQIPHPVSTLAKRKVPRDMFGRQDNQDLEHGASRHHPRQDSDRTSEMGLGYGLLSRLGLPRLGELRPLREAVGALDGHDRQ